MNEYPFLQKSVLKAEIGEDEIMTLILYRNSLEDKINHKDFKATPSVRIAFRQEVKRINAFIGDQINAQVNADLRTLTNK